MLNRKWLFKGISLEHCMESAQRNNFTLIRLAAALMVVESHSHFFKDKSADPFLKETLRVTFLGLPCFFFLSGLLVTQSLYKSASWKNFLWKRILRIYPASCIAVLCCAFVLGPLVTTYSLKDYFSSQLLYQFISSCSLVRVYQSLPGVFEHSVMGPDVNLSLWSIVLELKLYLGLLIFWILKIRWKRYVLISLIIILVFARYFIPANTEELLTKKTGHEFSIFIYEIYVPLFLLGVLCSLYKKRIFVANYWILLIIPGTAAGLYFEGFYTAFLFVIVPAVVLYIAAIGVRTPGKIGPRTDLSYGIYVFAFPVQQVIANYLHPANPAIMFLLSVVFVLPLAWASWHFVEKNALKLKSHVK